MGFAGKKFSKSHSTVIEPAREVITQVAKDPAVKKIANGIIQRIKNGPPAIKFTTVAAGLEVKIRGNIAIQTFYIYTDEPDKVRTMMEKEFYGKTKKTS